MLKKCLIVGLSTLLLVTGCSGNNTSKSVREETETAYVTTFENGSKTYSIKSLPFNEISYGDSAFGLKVRTSIDLLLIMATMFLQLLNWIFLLYPKMIFIGYLKIMVK